ncbi:DUF4350 domain-containing protein [Planctomycetota bacterium]
MKRVWISLALLSASWLFGLSYYYDAVWWIWAILVVTGTLLLIRVPLREPTSTESVMAAVFLLPAIDMAPWPYRIAPLLLFVGLVLFYVPIPRRWPVNLASAFIIAGVILLVQSLAITTYEYLTASSHELPWPVPDLIYRVVTILGIEASLDGTAIGMYSPRAVHLLGATWELFFDPVTLCFLAGAIVMLFIFVGIKQKTRILKSLFALVILIISWLFLRSGILISIYMHRALRTGYDNELALMNQFWNPWLYLVLLAGPVLLCLRFVNINPGKSPVLASSSILLHKKCIAAIVLACAGVFLLIVGLLLDMPGDRKQGRIFVDEHKSEWERTDTPFDTDWYGHDSGYNYACIYDYCSRFYDMSRLEVEIDDNALRDCDVLMVKVPTARYTSDEIAAIERFVERGGGLMLVGEHTNVFKTGTYINEIADIFGFRFRYDCLFDMDTTFEQLYNPPLVAHPIVQNMPSMNFAVSCSIAPGLSAGRAIIRSTGLKNLFADYHASNFYPQVEDKAQMRYGAFIQLWTTRFGDGRVLAFSDSTIYSNFAAFEPGKAELMLGMLEWLNHSNAYKKLRPLIICMAVLFVAGAMLLSRSWDGAWIVIISAGLLGWALAAFSTRIIHQYSMPLPKQVRPMIKVIVDRTVCDAPLSKSGFIQGERNGFGIFERWILRLGYFTSRQSGSDAFTGNLLVFTQPNLTVPNEFRDELVEYVSSGGRVLVLDSPENTDSTANSLLYPFGLTVDRTASISGQSGSAQSWPSINIDSACRIEGGQAILSVNNQPVASTVSFGAGTVTAIGFGSRFADAYMGVTGDVVPDEQLREVFELEFLILQKIVTGM